MNETLIETRKLQPGDHVQIVGMTAKWFTVKDATDPSLVLVETDTGRQFKTGRMCVTATKRQGDQE